MEFAEVILSIFDPLSVQSLSQKRQEVIGEDLFPNSWFPGMFDLVLISYVVIDFQHILVCSAH